jgi:hypothetical protein
VWEAEKRPDYSRRQVTQAKRRARDVIQNGGASGEACTDFAVVHAVNELIQTSEPADQELARRVMQDLLRPFVKEIVEADLSETESARIEATVNQLHILCALCAAVLEAIDAAHALTETLADEIADLIIEEAGKEVPLPPVVQEVLRRALHGSFGILDDVIADPVRVRMLRLIGYSTCPDVSDHPEVRKHCVDPLKDELVTAPMQEWVAGGFPADAEVLRRARRHRRR